MAGSIEPPPCDHPVYPSMLPLPTLSQLPDAFLQHTRHIPAGLATGSSYQKVSSLRCLFAAFSPGHRAAAPQIFAAPDSTKESSSNLETQFPLPGAPYEAPNQLRGRKVPKGLGRGCWLPARPGAVLCFWLRNTRLEGPTGSSPPAGVARGLSSQMRLTMMRLARLLGSCPRRKRPAAPPHPLLLSGWGASQGKEPHDRTRGRAWTEACPPIPGLAVPELLHQRRGKKPVPPMWGFLPHATKCRRSSRRPGAPASSESRKIV